jgi:hypothetical protein
MAAGADGNRDEVSATGEAISQANCMCCGEPHIEELDPQKQ